MIETGRTRDEARQSGSRGVHVAAAALLRRLADREPSRLPVLSAYLDLRPPADAAQPAVREAKVILRDRLDESLDQLPAHGAAHDSVATDGERIRMLLDEEAAVNERGVALFACHGEGLFERLGTWVPFDPRVEMGAVPFLVPLARFVDHEPTLVALADTNTLRLLVSQPGRLEELPGLDDAPDDYTRTEAGGWSQARYQRHVDAHRGGFARQAAQVIERTSAQEGAVRVILAGDEVAVPRLRRELPKAIADRVREVLRLELRATLDEIESKVLPAIERLEAADARDAADRLMGAIGAGGLGIGRVGPVMRALGIGQGLELLLDVARPSTEEDANEAVRLAARTGTRITFVADHPGIRELGGIGLLLRYRT
jgi:peptide chain release factor subunit 1